VQAFFGQHWQGHLHRAADQQRDQAPVGEASAQLHVAPRHPQPVADRAQHRAQRAIGCLRASSRRIRRKRQGLDTRKSPCRNDEAQAVKCERQAQCALVVGEGEQQRGQQRTGKKRHLPHAHHRAIGCLQQFRRNRPRQHRRPGRDAEGLRQAEAQCQHIHRGQAGMAAERKRRQQEQQHGAGVLGQ
jgi:hypothetical protein